MAKTDAPPSFAELIESAQKLPDLLGSRPVDLSSPFALPLPPAHRVVDTSKDPEKFPSVADYDCDAHVEYFVLPTNKAEYEAALNQILKGKAVLRYEDRNFTKEGDYVVALCYFTYRRSEEREAARRKREEDEEREALIRRRRG
jgi:hypothetical protein